MEWLVIRELMPGEEVGSTLLNMVVFGIFIVITMTLVLRASKSTKSTKDFYTGGSSFTGPQNGFAIAGDYLSAASFLGIAGAIAINGYDGFLYSIGFLVAWLVALMLVAELMRNTGRFTMADVLSFRLKQRPVRMAAALATLAVCLFYLIARWRAPADWCAAQHRAHRPVPRGGRRVLSSCWWAAKRHHTCRWSRPSPHFPGV